MTARSAAAHRPSSWRTAALVGLLFFCFAGWNSWLELYHLSGGLPHNSDAVRLVFAAFLAGFFPASFLALAALRLRGRIGSPWVQTLLLWLPTIAGFLIALGTTLADPGATLGPIQVGFGAVALASYVAWRKVGFARREVPYWLFVVGLAWLLVGVSLSQMLHNLRGNLPSIAHASPLIIGVGCPVLFVLHAWIDRWWQERSSQRGRRLFALAFCVASAAALVGIWHLQTLFIGMYLPVKAFVAASVAICLWLVFEPVLVWAARRLEALVWLGALVALAGVTATGWALAQPIGERFGSFPVRSVVGLSAQVLSTADDADKDGYYAESVGGNDCDDTDASRTPMAREPAKNCWADLAEAEETPPAPDGENPSAAHAEHVVLLVVDALRGDLLTDPEAAEHVPNLRSLAERSITFERAYSPGNATLLSVLPMLSGASPIDALDSLAAAEPAPPDELLAEESVLSLAGDDFCTAFLSYSTLAKRWLVENAGEELDVARSVDEQTETGHSAPLVYDGVRQTLAECEGRRVMLALYVDDPHRDYQKQGYSCRDGSAGGRRCYLEEVSVVDDMIGQLLELLEERQMLQRTLFVVTSDHGEAFEEHGHTQHATSVYEEQIHVPLVVYAPPMPARRVDEPVSLLGFKATVADATGLELDDKPLYRSWLSVAQTPQLAQPPLVHNWMGEYKRGWTAPSSAIIVGDEKLVYDWRTSRVEFFDLERDPNERIDLARRRPERAEELLQMFRQQHVRMQTTSQY